MEKIIIDKIDSLNQIVLQAWTNDSNASLIKNFAKKCAELLEADFVIAWSKLHGGKDYDLVYKSKNSPKNDEAFKVVGSSKEVSKKGYILFNSDIKKENFSKDISSHLKSYLLIPVRYGEHIYGSILLGYKKLHEIKNEELILANNLANTVAHLVTINWLIEKEQKALTVAEKQKEIEVLLSQEKQKNEFLANATHEFRTPLAVIRGTADLALRAKEKREKEMELALKDINKEVANLSEIIADLVTLIFQGEGVEGKLVITPVDLCMVIDKAISRLKILMSAKGIAIKTHCNLKEIVVAGDKEYLDKLFINLIRNAITYGKEGGKIDVKMEVKGKMVKVKVIDTGIGITKEELPYIFERFYRTKKAREISNIGTGLGLAISKWIVESHGGKIEVQSTEGKGTAFTLTLPLA
jgi:signal transduction histidine kinase